LTPRVIVGGAGETTAAVADMAVSRHRRELGRRGRVR
jgi:hypothetical protein